MMDTRGQGSSWFIGETPDPDGDGAAAQAGFMTQGILDPATYFYRRVFTDAVRAVETIRTHAAVDAGRVAVAGGSQGGGISLAAAGLVADLAGVITDVPFLCDFPRSTTLVDTNPYGEIVRYLKAHRDHTELAMRTLSYFDGAVLARSAKAPALFSVGLMDDICPPSTVYAAFNAYGGPKEIREYPYNEHEGGQGFHDRVNCAGSRSGSRAERSVEVEDLLEPLVEAGRGIGQRVDQGGHLGLPAIVDGVAAIVDAERGEVVHLEIGEQVRAADEDRVVAGAGSPERVEHLRPDGRVPAAVLGLLAGQGRHGEIRPVPSHSPSTETGPGSGASRARDSLSARRS